MEDVVISVDQSIDNIDRFTRLINESINPSFVPQSIADVGGGCINRCYRISGNEGQSYFIKQHNLGRLANFTAEQIGLQQLAVAEAIRVPQPLLVCANHNQAVLILEDLDINKRGMAEDWLTMGRQLAQLHKCSITELNSRLSDEAQLPTDAYGVRVPNTSLSQEEGFIGEHEDWATYFCYHRLRFQFKQARKRHGNDFPLQEQVLEVAKKLLSYHPKPALVHGDLWGGNANFALIDDRITPVIYDPAAYVADRETDLALSELFGGFPSTFYEGYQSEYPLDYDGYSKRREVYNLYHILNHYNLFGDSYLPQAHAMIETICRYG